MNARILQAAGDFRRQHITGDTHDEELSQSGSEQQLRGNPRIAATENHRMGSLVFCEFREHFRRY
jgi:hypothetical protein